MSGPNTQADLRNIPISDIKENPVALRGVDKESEQYQSLRDSIRAKGILMPITVREKKDAEGKPYFEIADGLHRYSGAKDVGVETLPVNVISQSDAEVLETQIVANLCRVDTKPVEFTKQLQRMMALNPTMTVSEAAERVNQSPSWVTARLGLLKLDAAIQTSVDDGQIVLQNAYALSKLPKDEQFNFLDQAMAMPPNEFVPTVNNRLKEIRDAARQGKAAGEAQFVPVSHIRSKKDLEDALAGDTLNGVVAAAGSKTAAEGAAATLKWVLSLDDASVSAAKAKFDARQKERDEAKRKREVERAEKKAAEATANAAKVKEEAGVA